MSHDKKNDDVRPFLTRPMVIDWLQWGEFPEKLGDLDYPAITLHLIAEYKKAYESAQATIAKQAEEIAALKEEVTSERMRLAACGVAALQNTDEAREFRIKSGNEYYSASYHDVCKAVDREMVFRERANLTDDYRNRNSKLLEANKILRDAIDHYLEVQKFLAAPEADTCVSSNDFIKALSSAGKILVEK